MLRSFLIGLAGLLTMASCQSNAPMAAVESTPRAIVSALESSAQSNGPDVQRAFASNRPLLLVFWQSW